MSNNIISSQIENANQYNKILKIMICAMCLDIPLSAKECLNCNTYLCEDCYEILKISEKNCITSKCNGNIKKANKFFREILSQIIIECSYCHKEHIELKFYEKHLLEDCEVYKFVDFKKSTFLQRIRELNKEAENLTKLIDEIKLSTTMSIIDRYPKKINYEEIKKKLLTNQLSNTSKMEFYNSVIKGNISAFKIFLINKNYPIFEEVSAPSFGWTVLHYAMHYGQMEIIDFIFEYLIKKNNLDLALQLRSSDNRCPLLCLVKSNAVDICKKKLIFFNLDKKFKLNLSPEVKNELVERKILFN